MTQPYSPFRFKVPVDLRDSLAGPEAPVTRRQMTPEERERYPVVRPTLTEVLEAVKAGQTPAQIAQAHGVSLPRVQRLCVLAKRGGTYMSRLEELVARVSKAQMEAMLADESKGLVEIREELGLRQGEFVDLRRHYGIEVDVNARGTRAMRARAREAKTREKTAAPAAAVELSEARERAAAPAPRLQQVGLILNIDETGTAEELQRLLKVAVAALDVLAGPLQLTVELRIVLRKAG